MTDERIGEAMLAPVAGSERIALLDTLRGIAILGIFYMNVPFLGGWVLAAMGDPRVQEYAPFDRLSWSVVQVLAEGTQRAILELLFGAGLMILTTRADATGRAIAGFYYRRNLWLFLFGMVHVFGLMWPGDILHTYALAAMLLFPFRLVRPRALLPMGLAFATLTAAFGVYGYSERAALAARVEAVAEHGAHTPADTHAVAVWNEASRAMEIGADQREQMREERAARLGSFGQYRRWIITQAVFYLAAVEFNDVAEAFCTMLIGVALFKWRVIQGGRSRRFYLAMLVGGYGFGLAARAIGVAEQTSFSPGPQTIWITDEYARLAVALGHVALVNLAVTTRAGAALLAPFAAAGRTAFSLYIAESLIGLLLFPGFALGLWGRFGWTGLYAVATAVTAVLLIAANMWVRYFRSGPLEWAWRSLAYWRRQPFRIGRRDAAPIVIGP